MDEGIIERCEDMGNCKNLFTLCDLRSERDSVFLLGCFNFFGGLIKIIQKSVSRSSVYESILKQEIRNNARDRRYR
jgi:hypothetical protein